MFLMIHKLSIAFLMHCAQSGAFCLFVSIEFFKVTGISNHNHCNEKNSNFFKYLCSDHWYIDRHKINNYSIVL